MTDAVEVIVKRAYPAWFSAVFGRTQNWLTTRAVALIRGNSGACLWTLQKDFTINHGTVTSPCGLMVTRNVNDNGASMSLPSIGAGEAPVTLSRRDHAERHSAVQRSVPDDSGLQSDLRHVSVRFDAGFWTVRDVRQRAVPTLNPGCFTSLSGTYDLTPGLYVVTGDLNATLTCSTCVSGTNGVTIVVGGKVNLNGSTTSLIAPPGQQGTAEATVTTAGAPGVLFYQTDTTTSPENFSAQQLLGMLYAPGAHINLDGGGSSLTISYVVAADIIANGAVITVPSATCNSGVSQTPVLAE